MSIVKFTEWLYRIACDGAKPLFLFALLVLFSHLSHATVTITDSANKFDQYSIGYLYDADQSKTIDEISQTTFTQQIPNQFALGYHSGAAWFKLTVQNNSQEEYFILNLTEPFWTTFDLFEHKDNQWQVRKNGLDISLADREIKNAMPTFSIQVKSGQSKTIYIRGTTVSSFIGAIQIFTQNEYYRPGRMSIAKTYNTYSGVLIFIMLLTGFLYFVMHERIYLYYIGYVLSFIVWINVQNGNYLYAGIPGWIHALHAIGALVVFFLVLFTYEILDLKHKSPKVAQLFRLSAIVIILCSILISMDLPHINLFFNIFSSLFFTLLLVTAIRAWISNYFVRARYYLIALAIYMPTMALMTMTYNGLLPNIDVTRYAFAFGSLVEIVFFSFILVSHYYDTRQKSLQMQQELLTEREQQAERLESEVQKRTVELFNINEELRHQTDELEKTKQRLTVEATTDSLSKLYNRRHFLQLSIPAFDESIAYEKPLSLLMIDLDRFKGINDNFGHQNNYNSIPEKATDWTGDQPLTDRIQQLSGATCFIGLSSGLSWLSWAIGVPTVLISGFTKEYNEFDTSYRVINTNVCNGCWNDVKEDFDKNNWMWCPRHKDFECSKQITPQMVIDQLNKIL